MQDFFHRQYCKFVLSSSHAVILFGHRKLELEVNTESSLIYVGHIIWYRRFLVRFTNLSPKGLMSRFGRWTRLRCETTSRSIFGVATVVGTTFLLFFAKFGLHFVWWFLANQMFIFGLFFCLFIFVYIYIYISMNVSENNGTPPNHQFENMGFPWINHPFWGPTPYFGKHLCLYIYIYIYYTW